MFMFSFLHLFSERYFFKYVINRASMNETNALIH